jgi:hypothetical protein
VKKKRKIRKTFQISVFVESHQVGLSQNYFGKIEIENKVFDYNFSILVPIENFQEKTIKEYLRFIKSIDLILFDDKNKEIDLNRKEFSFFVSILALSLIMSSGNPSFVLHLFMGISEHKAGLLTQKKFGCQIKER